MRTTAASRMASSPIADGGRPTMSGGSSRLWSAATCRTPRAPSSTSMAACRFHVYRDSEQRRGRLQPCPRAIILARGLSLAGRGGELLHERFLPLLDFLRGQVFLVGRYRPAVAVWIGEGTGAVAPELIDHGAHRTGHHLRASLDGAVEQRIAIVDVQPQ